MGFAAFCVGTLIFGMQSVEDGPLWLATFTAFLLFAFSFRFWGPGGNRILRFFRESFPFFVLAPSYYAAGALSRAYHDRYFDDEIIRLDEVVFGGHPNAYFADALPFVPLSELLHFCYYFYLWLIPLLGLYLYLKGRRREFLVTVTTVASVFYFCYAIFILFPVLGPYYTFDRVEAPGSFFVGLVYRTLEGGASIGTAFPSSHCAAATAIAICGIRFAAPPMATFITIVAVGIVVATIYGGFHYAIDSLVGVVVGLVGGLLGTRWHRRLETWISSTRPGAKESGPTGE